MVGLFTHVRKMLKRDLLSVLKIEQENCDCPWNERMFRKYMGKDYNRGIVAESREIVVGYTLYQILREGIYVTELSVDKEFQRRGVGTQLIECVIESALVNNWNKITYYCMESNLAAQLFLRSNGFKWVHTHEGEEAFYDDTDEPVYEMEIDLIPHNRMSTGGLLENKIAD